MHELSVCQGLLAQVKQIADQHQAHSIKNIHLSIGPLSGIEPQLLEYAFPFVSANTIADKASLIITSQPLRVECDICQRQSEVDSQDLTCRICHAWQTRLISGDELVLTRVELETSEV